MAEFTVLDPGAVGVIYDTPAQSLANNVWSNGNNVRFDEEGASPIPQDKEVFSAAPVEPLWLKQFPPTENPLWVYGNLSSMYVVQNGTHYNITRPGGYNGIPEQRWQGTIFNGVGIFNNAIDTPQAWSRFDTGVNLLDLNNWPTGWTANSIRGYKFFLVALNYHNGVERNPYGLYLSNSAAPGTVPPDWDYSDPASDSVIRDIADGGDGFVDSLGMGDIQILYKERSTWGMQYIGPPNYIRTWKILDEQGLLYRDCVVATPKGHVLLTQDDLIIHQGGLNSYQSILDARLTKWLFKTIDPESFYSTFLVPNYPKTEVWVCFPSLGSPYANRAVMWNWTDGSIGIRELPETPFAAAGALDTTTSQDLEWGD